MDSGLSEAWQKMQHSAKNNKQIKQNKNPRCIILHLVVPDSLPPFKISMLKSLKLVTDFFHTILSGMGLHEG
jgi:hypothetical protein